MKFINKVLSFIFPHKCTFCREAIEYTNSTYICSDCINSLPYTHEPKCVRCNAPRPNLSVSMCSMCRKYNTHFQKSYTPLIYKENARRAILSMKFYNKEHYAKSFAFLIANNIIFSDNPKIDFITYVPLSPKGLGDRGFNQSEIVARKLGEILHLPVLSTLRRSNDSLKQSTLSFAKRRINAKNSFFGKDMKIEGNALLIDDIYTTGSTTDYCASLLLKMGADKVFISAVALKTKD